MALVRLTVQSGYGSAGELFTLSNVGPERTAVRVVAVGGGAGLRAALWRGLRVRRGLDRRSDSAASGVRGRSLARATRPPRRRARVFLDRCCGGVFRIRGVRSVVLPSLPAARHGGQRGADRSGHRAGLADSASGLGRGGCAGARRSRVGDRPPDHAAPGRLRSGGGDGPRARRGRSAGAEAAAPCGAARRGAEWQHALRDWPSGRALGDARRGLIARGARRAGSGGARGLVGAGPVRRGRACARAFRACRRRRWTGLPKWKPVRSCVRAPGESASIEDRRFVHWTAHSSQVQASGQCFEAGVACGCGRRRCRP